MIKKILSYLLPIPVKIIPSKTSEQLELTWNNGKLVLDTKHTNYSFGNLQKVLHKGLKNIGKENIIQMNNILILGVAGGSVIETLVKDFNYQNNITGVEIDPVVIKVAEKYFNINKYSNLEILIQDAQLFVEKTKILHDLIIIDIFEDCFMPDFLFTEKFVENIKRILKPKGYILFNTIVLNEQAKKNNIKYSTYFDNKFSVSNFPNIDHKNELFIIKKEYE